METAIRIPIELFFSNIEQVRKVLRENIERFKFLPLEIDTSKVETQIKGIKFNFRPIVENIKEEEKRKFEEQNKIKYKATVDLTDLNKVKAEEKTERFIRFRPIIEGLEKFKDKVSGLFKQFFSGSGGFEAVFKFQYLSQSVLQVAEYFNKFLEGSRKTEVALADLSALTGITGEELKKFKNNARELALAFGTSTSEQLEMFKGVISRLGVEFAKNGQAVKEFANLVNILGKASGLDAVSSMDALTTAILQMGVPLDDQMYVVKEATRMMNIMAEGAKQGASEIPQVAEALKVAGVAAKNANISFAELNAAIQTMAMGGKFGAEAGTALRNVINRLQARLTTERTMIVDVLEKMGISGEEVAMKLTTEGLGAALEMLRDGLNRLGSDLERNVALVRIFGEEGMTAAGVLLSRVDTLRTFSDILEGTNTAFEQANIVMGTTSERINRIVNQIKMSISGIFSKLPSFFSVFSSVTVQILPFLQSMLAIRQILGFGLLQAVSGFAVSLLSKLVPSVVTAQVATAGLGASMKALAVATWTALAPIMPYVLAIGALVGAGLLLYDVLHKSAEEKREDAKASLEATQANLKYTQERINQVESLQKLSKTWMELGAKQNKTKEEVEAFNQVNLKMIEIYGSAVGGAKSFEEATENVKKKLEEQRQELEKLRKEEYELKVKEIREKTEITKLDVEVEAEKVEDAIDEIGNLFSYGLKDLVGTSVEQAFQAKEITDKMKLVVENMKKSGTKEELIKYFSEGIDLSKRIESAEERKKVVDAYKKLFDLKNKEFERSQEEMKEMFLTTIDFLKSSAKDNIIEFGGVKYNLTNAEEMNKLVEQVGKQYGMTREQVEAILRNEQKVTEQKELQEKKEKNIYYQAVSGLQNQKEHLKLELLELMYKQKKGVLLSEEEKKRIEILKLQAMQTGQQLRELEGLEKEVEKLFGTEEKRVKSTKTMNEILREQFELKRKELENEVLKRKIVAENLEKQEKEKVLREIENYEQSKTIELYRQIYGVEAKINKETNEVSFVWDKKLSQSGKILKTRKEQVEIENQLASVILNQSKRVEETGEKIDEVYQKIMEIEKLKLDIDVGDIDVEEGKKKIGQLYRELQEVARAEIKTIEQDLESAVKGDEKAIEERKKRIKELKGVIKQAIEYERQEREKLAKSIIELEEKKTKLILEQTKKEYEKRIEIENSLLAKYSERYRSRIQEQYEEEKKILEAKKNEQIITEVHYNNRIRELELKQQQEERVIELVNQAYIEELKREQMSKELEIEKQRLLEQKVVLEERGLIETEQYRKVIEEIERVDVEMRSKLDVMSSYGNLVQGAVENMMMSLAEGNREGAKESMKEVGATLIAMVKKYAISTVTSIILGQLGLAGATSGLAALLLVPAIRGLVTAGVNALLEPLIKSLSHFASGGRVDRETIAVIGEKETEWVVRDRDIIRILNEFAQLEYNNITKLLAEYELNRSFETDRILRRQIEIFEMSELVGKNVKVLLESSKDRNIVVDIDIEEVKKAIYEVREAIWNLDGRIYVVSEDIERELKNIEYRKAKLRRL